MKRARQQKIVEIISARQIATQQELAEALERCGIAATQSSVSRDIVELGLTKAHGYYAVPEQELTSDGLVTGLDTAGDNLIVVKTEIGQAQPAALRIDHANIAEIVGTLAGDDTILVAVKNAAAQRVALKKIIELFTRPAASPARTHRRAAQPGAHARRIL